jgi:hypothetical protein
LKDLSLQTNEVDIKLELKEIVRKDCSLDLCGSGQISFTGDGQFVSIRCRKLVFQLSYCQLLNNFAVWCQ